MRGLSILIILLVAFYLIGCANTQMVKDAEKDTEYRKSLLEYTESQKKQQKEVKGTSVKREVVVCDEYHSTIKRKIYEEVHGTTLEENCYYTTIEDVTVPIEMPQEWMDQWNKDSKVETEVEQAKNYPVCELCIGY